MGIFASCMKEEIITEVNNPDPGFKVTASLGEDVTTRTHMGPGFKTYWSEEDAISVLNKGKHWKYSIDSEAGSNKAEFAFEKAVDGISGGTETEDNSGSTKYDFIGVYPFNENNSVKHTGNIATIETSIPAEQKYVAGSYSENALPMVAYSNPLPEFSFQHVGTVISVGLVGKTTVASATLKGNRSIAGQTTVTLNTEKNKVESVVANVLDVPAATCSVS